MKFGISYLFIVDIISTKYHHKTIFFLKEIIVLFRKKGCVYICI